MTAKTKLILHVLIGVFGYSVWALMAYFDRTLRHDFLVFNIGMATGTIGLALRDMKTSADSPADVAAPVNPPGQILGKQAGHATTAAMFLLVVISLMALSACSLIPQRYGAVEEGFAQTVVQSSERTICRDVPIGTWLRLYGANADRLKGWQSLCFNPVTAPLNAETIAAILKVYPGFVESNGTPPPVVPSAVLGIGASTQSGQGAGEGSK